MNAASVIMRHYSVDWRLLGAWRLRERENNWSLVDFESMIRINYSPLNFLIRISNVLWSLVITEILKADGTKFYSVPYTIMHA